MMKIEEIINKTSFNVLYIFLLFALIYISIGNSISESVENILVSRAQVYSQDHSFALTPLVSNRYYEEIDKIDIKKLDTLKNSNTFVTADARITALRQFLIDYNSPMYPYADVFITEADKYGLDWRLVASISGVESGFGNLIPLNSNNAWGWKGGPNLTFSMFDDWGHGASVVTRGLALNYGTHMTPFQIEPIYCPPCGQNPEHLWANGVIKFQNQIDMYLKGF